jgi:flagellar assembly factor FliW
MKIWTRNFGELEISEDRIIYFPQGIIAFDRVKKFVLVEDKDKDLPFCWLQAVEEPDLAFVLINPFYFKKDYEFDLPEETVKELEIEKEEDVLVFALVVIPDDVSKMSANLLAPLIINHRKKKGKQVILDDNRYKTKHFIMEELKSSLRGGMGNAGVK